MGKFEQAGKVGLRDRETKDLIAVYPHEVKGDDKEIEDKVRFWYYQKSCSAENEMKNYFVDTLSPMELKNSTWL